MTETILTVFFTTCIVSLIWLLILRQQAKEKKENLAIVFKVFHKMTDDYDKEIALLKIIIKHQSLRNKKKEDNNNDT